MSLVAFALRTIMVRSLRGATLAGQGVYDSPVDPAAIAAKASAPTIFVFSDSEVTEDIEGRAILAGERTIDLSLLIVLPATFEATVGGATVAFADRKAGAAAAIDMLYRQFERALLVGDTPWSALWPKFVVGVRSVAAHAYVLPVGKDLHLPARAIRISVEPINSPPIGQPPDCEWAALIAAMQTDAGLAPLAPLIAAAIEGQDLPQWEVDALELGDTPEDAAEMGYGPIDATPGLAPAPIAEVALLDTAADAPDPSYTLDVGQPTSFGA